MQTRLLVVGQGYVGLPLSVRAVECGFRVSGLDTDEKRVARLLTGNSFAEDVSDIRLQGALSSGNFHVTTNIDDCGEFDVAVVTVPTPLRDSQPDISYISAAALAIGPRVRRNSLVVLESTTYPGTTEDEFLPILERESGLRGGEDFFVAYSPERIDPGNGTYTFVTTPKLVAGINELSLKMAMQFYEEIIDQVVPVSSCKVAETAKLLENTFRHVNIALVNELAIFTHQLGINIWDVVQAASTKPFGFMKFTPGPGVGGHCLPIDPAYLAWKVKTTLNKPFRFVDLAIDVNDGMPEYIVERVFRCLNLVKKPIAGSSIAALGVSYKKNSSDARESPAAEIIHSLLKLGADVTIVDPCVVELPSAIRSVPLVRSIDEIGLNEFDLVLMLTDHDGFDVKGITAAAQLIFDTRKAFPVQHNIEHL